MSTWQMLSFREGNDPEGSCADALFLTLPKSAPTVEEPRNDASHNHRMGQLLFVFYQAVFESALGCDPL